MSGRQRSSLVRLRQEGLMASFVDEEDYGRRNWRTSKGIQKGDRKEVKQAGSPKATNWFRLAAELDERLRTETGPPSNSMGLRRLATLSRYVE